MPACTGLSKSGSSTGGGCGHAFFTWDAVRYTLEDGIEAAFERSGLFFVFFLTELKIQLGKFKTGSVFNCFSILVVEEGEGEVNE